MSVPVLLVTKSDDNAAVDLVADAIRARGGAPIRLDTDRYPESIAVSTWLGRGGVERRVLVTDAGAFDLSEVRAVWYRRFAAGTGLPAALGDTRPACVHEARRTLHGMIAALDAFQLDPLEAVRGADHKELQLKRAATLGLDVPKTLITCSADELRRFARAVGGPVVTKMQSSFAIYRGSEELVVFTTPIDTFDLQAAEGLRYAPMIFQEKLEKRLDIRATVIGHAVYAAGLDSQQRTETAVDWRREGASTIEDWQPFTLPEATAAALRALTAAFGLTYAAADFVLTRDDRLCFLEINAGGEWFWLQRHPGLPIAEALADALLDGAAQADRRAKGR